MLGRGTPARTPPAMTSPCSCLALAQLPAEDLDREILLRADIGGATHAFTSDCREANYSLLGRLRVTRWSARRSSSCPNRVDASDRRRRRGSRGAWVAELTDDLDLSPGPRAPGRSAARSARSRAVHHFDQHGYRHTRSLTHQEGQDIAVLELRHRGRARVEDSDPRRQGHRHAHPPALRVRAQPDLARGALTDRRTPARLDEAGLALTVTSPEAEPNRFANGCCTSPPSSLRHGWRTRRPTRPRSDLCLDRSPPHSRACARTQRSAPQPPRSLLDHPDDRLAAPTSFAGPKRTTGDANTATISASPRPATAPTTFHSALHPPATEPRPPTQHKRRF